MITEELSIQICNFALEEVLDDMVSTFSEDLNFCLKALSHKLSCASNCNASSIQEYQAPWNFSLWIKQSLLFRDSCLLYKVL